MRHWFHTRPIQVKLLTIVLLSCTLALLLATSTSFFLQQRQIRHHLHDEITTLADIICENSSAGIVFEDKKTLQIILKSLEAKSSITTALIYGQERQLLAVYNREDKGQQRNGYSPPLPHFTGLQFQRDYAELSRPIMLDGEYIGHLYLKNDLAGPRSNIQAIALIMAAVLLFGLLLAFVMSAHLLKIIVSPITALSELTQQISNENQYHLRAEIVSQDELGQLATTFNDMIEEIERRDAYLEEQVTKRTLDLHQQKLDLEVARDRAEAANRAKSQFLANMSHEIRTPMNAIISMTDMAMRSEEPEKKQGFLQTVKHSADSLLGILNDILDFSKIEAGQLQVDTRPFSLGQLVQHVVSTMNVQAAKKGLSLQVNIAPELPTTFIGDDLRILQILINLVGNAVKFTQQGGVTVSVEQDAKMRKGDQYTLRFSVTDTGIGIAESNLEQIFNSFEQVDNSYTRKYSGTGLGLSISRQLAGLMGGKMWVQSRLGHGSTFYFTLPAQATAQVHRIHEIRHTSEKQAETVTGLNILIVDDNEINRDVAGMIFEKNHTVNTATNGLEALELLSTHSFNVVFMDVQMPFMDGLTTTNIIRAIEQQNNIPNETPANLIPALSKQLARGHLPIVALTAHAMAGDEEMCFTTGMDKYVTKPFRQQHLLSIIQELHDQGYLREVEHRLKTSGSTSVNPPNTPEVTNYNILAKEHLTQSSDFTDDQLQQLLTAARLTIHTCLETALTAVQQNDFSTVGTTAHTLKGTLLQLGFTELAQNAEAIHQGAKAGLKLQYSMLLGELQNALETFCCQPKTPAE